MKNIIVVVGNEQGHTSIYAHDKVLVIANQQTIVNPEPFVIHARPAMPVPEIIQLVDYVDSHKSGSESRRSRRAAQRRDKKKYKNLW